MWEKFYKSFEKILGSEKIYDKYFKTHYAGKPTKRFLKLIKQAKQVGEISFAELFC